MVKKPPAMQEAWAGKIPWRRAGQPTPAFLPGESHGQRSMTGYSPRGRKVSDTTERRGTSGAHVEAQTEEPGTSSRFPFPVRGVSTPGGTPRQLPGVLTSKQCRQTGQRQEFRAHSGHTVRPWPELPTLQHVHGPWQGRGVGGLTSFRMDCSDLRAVQGTLRSSPGPQFELISCLALSFPYGPALTSVHNHFDDTDLCRRHKLSRPFFFVCPLLSPEGRG